MIQDIAEKVKQNKMAQYWLLLQAMNFSNGAKNIIDNKISMAINKINSTEELETKIEIIKNLKTDVIEILQFSPSEIDNSYLLLALAILEDFYQGVFWLDNLEKSRATQEIYWSVLYSCVDRLEGVLFRLKQLQNLTENYHENCRELIIFIESIFNKILQTEMNQYQEQENFKNEQVAIKRALLSGLELLDLIQKQFIYTQKKQEKILALKNLKSKIDSRKIKGRKQTQNSIDFEKSFYETMDSFRQNGWKLYTNE
jgi:predicted S18 family serine protease